MSSAALGGVLPPADDRTGTASRPPEEQTGASKSFGRRVFEDTLNNARARVGMVWVGLLLLFAVFAPLIANTHPVAMKMDGKWSSPLLKHLTPTDVTLLVAFFAGVVLGFVR